MIDLGAYAAPVLSAYAVSFALIGSLILISLHRARKAHAALRAAEKEQGQTHV